MNNLVTPAEIKTLGRPIGKVSDEKLNAYIAEVENMNLRPVLGNALFTALLKDSLTNEQTLLLNGGDYEDGSGGSKHIAGLKVTMSYFVYAQNVMSGDFESTRYGMVIKDGDYSSHLSSKERSDCYNNALEVANAYLKECLAYCKHVGLIKNPQKGVAYSTAGVTIRKIG